MKLLLIGCIVLAIVFTVLFIQQGKASQTSKAAGIANGKLTACPQSPNCICTEFPGDASHYLAPIHLANIKTEYVITHATAIIIAMGGVITQTGDNYLAATFTSSLFKFVDDFEIRLDPATETLHIRSASRVGYGDMGVNKKRVEAFIAEWQKIKH